MYISLGDIADARTLSPSWIVESLLLLHSGHHRPRLGIVEKEDSELQPQIAT